ncbi:Zinc metalloproteinase dpy-31 [Lamellibrachia satsuma]|nr:Zinc metalloproteinase dpy-31 [Lamellibrachia satsuma]
MSRTFFALLGFASVFLAIQARSVVPVPSDVWKPDNTSMKDWEDCNGMSCEKWHRVQRKMLQFMATSAAADGLQFDVTKMNESIVNSGENRLEDCIILTEEQVDELLELQKNEFFNGTDHQRQKRTIRKGAFSRWSLPIHWKFDGNHNAAEQKQVRSTLQHWTEQTCVRFNELGVHDPFDDNYIIFTRRPNGCYSYIGKVNLFPQLLNLRPSCFEDFGTPVHEVGHALGLWHEQQRPDRDAHIRILYQNLDFYKSQFVKRPVDEDTSVPYDIGSRNGRSNTMETLNPLYQNNIGQRVGLSFLTSKLINFAYCNATCKTKLPQPCQREGYQDPNRCDRCRCPDGFSGTYCRDVAPPVNANCGGKVVATYSPQAIKSPGFDSAKHYENKQECNWLITAPVNHRVELRFEDDFGLYSHTQGQCYHWVEVHNSKHFGSPGPRFCGRSRPQRTVTSETNEMMIVFRSNYSTHWNAERRGFKANFLAVPLPGVPRIPNLSSPSQKTTTPAPPTTTTTNPFNTMCGPVDLAFLIDSSGSIGKVNWPKILNFMKMFSSKLTVSPDRARISVISFGNDATLHFRLDSHTTLKSTEDAIDQIRWKDQWTNTGAALRVIKNDVFKWEHGDRSNAPNVAVLITDGPSNKDSWQTVPNAESARNAGIKIFAVGVGSQVDPVEMKGITGSKDRMTYVWDFDEMLKESTMKTLYSKICSLTSTSGIKTTTNSPVTTTTTKPQTGEPFRWQCDFEGSSGEGSTCDMVQSKEDNFDWTLKTGATPSRPTGPDSAHSGKYYIYIETSNPRRYGDRAVMLLPKLARGGHVCVRFNYHMFGFHINELQLAKRSSSGHLNKVWSMVGEKGNRWLHAVVDVELSSLEKFSIRRRSGQKGDETAKPVEFVRQLVESARSTESASSIKSARSIEFCEIDRIWIKLKIAL